MLVELRGSRDSGPAQVRIHLRLLHASWARGRSRFSQSWQDGGAIPGLYKPSVLFATLAKCRGEIDFGIASMSGAKIQRNNSHCPLFLNGSARGSVKHISAPFPDGSSTHIRPPWASTIVRDSASPRPNPSGLAEEKASNA